MGAVTGAGGRLLDWGWAGAALEGDASGDVHVVAEFAGGVLVAVIDGLGHGIEAAAAAQQAARVLESYAGEPLAALVERCHVALRGTRGAVMTLASLDGEGSMTWAGVGNVEAFLLRAGAGAERPRESIGLRGGIVGYQLPTVRASTLSVSPGDVLLMATDGVRGGFAEAAPPHASPQELADTILERYGRGSDDALVLAARYLGHAGPDARGPGEERPA